MIIIRVFVIRSPIASGACGGPRLRGTETGLTPPAESARHRRSWISHCTPRPGLGDDAEIGLAGTAGDHYIRGAVVWFSLNFKKL